MEKLVQKTCEVSKGIRGKNVCRGFVAIVTGSMGVPSRDRKPNQSSTRGKHKQKVHGKGYRQADFPHNICPCKQQKRVH
ncbi:Uncharacterized protein TCM_012576 isoform 1 [Theobroma cacao]|uniref:Uncharacterized protein isoform 1 n=1 Tax=Theobroma cacao TaxID=3641 RepID=A0A061FVW2_THECC|nr:Uncharacterized protein TCM_012576 isoform 1 [Theobroma cacao]